MRAIATALCLLAATAAIAAQKVGEHYRLAVINRVSPLVTKDKTAALVLAKWRHFTSVQAQYGGKDIGLYSEDARKTSLLATQLQRSKMLIPVPYNSVVTLLAKVTVPQSDRDTDDTIDLFQVRCDDGNFAGQTFWTADVVDHDVPLNGDKAILYGSMSSPGMGQVLCALTDEDLTDFMKAESAGNRDFMHAMLTLGQCFYVKNGTQGVFEGLGQVRITNGPHKGTLVFAEHAVLKDRMPFERSKNSRRKIFPTKVKRNQIR